MEKKKTNKVVYKLTTASAEPENVIENTPEPAPSAPVLPVKPAPEVDNNTDSQDSTNKDLIRVITHMGQQMTHMVWKMEKLDKLEKQNEYLLKEMRRLKKGGRRRRDEESEMSSADEGDPNAPKRSTSSTKRKRSHSSDYLMSSSEEDEQEEKLANWPLKSFEEVDQVAEKMKDPVYYAALKKYIKSMRLPLKDHKLIKLFKTLISNELILNYRKKPVENDGRRCTDTCPLLKLIESCWSKPKEDFYNKFLRKRIDCARKHESRIRNGDNSL